MTFMVIASTLKNQHGEVVAQVEHRFMHRCMNFASAPGFAVGLRWTTVVELPIHLRPWLCTDGFIR